MNNKQARSLFLTAHNFLKGKPLTESTKVEKLSDLSDDESTDEVKEKTARTSYVKAVEKAMAQEEGYDKVTRQEFEQDEEGETCVRCGVNLDSEEMETGVCADCWAREDEDDVEEGCGKSHKQTMKEGEWRPGIYNKWKSIWDGYYSQLERAQRLFGKSFLQKGSTSAMAREFAQEYDNFNEEFNKIKELAIINAKNTAAIIDIMDDIEKTISMGLYADEEEARDAGMMQP